MSYAAEPAVISNDVIVRQPTELNPLLPVFLIFRKSKESYVFVSTHILVFTKTRNALHYQQSLNFNNDKKTILTRVKTTQIDG